MSTYYYSIVRYVPDPARGEQVNVGVVVAADQAEFFRARFTDVRRSTRIRQLGFTQDLSFISDLANEMAASAQEIGSLRFTSDLTVWSLDTLRRAALEWTNVIQISEPHAALHGDPDKLVDELFTRYVAFRRPQRPRARSRKWVRRRVRDAFEEILQQPEILDHAPRISADVSFPGELEEHKFDYAIENGAVRDLVRTLAVEGVDKHDSIREVDALAWAIDDVRRAESSVRIDIVAVGEAQILERAARIYKALGAGLVREEEIEDWATQVVRDTARAESEVAES